MRKEHDVWKGEFKGHSIKVTNDGKAQLYIDGALAAKEKGLVHLDYKLQAEIPETDYIVIAELNGTKESIVTCEVMVAKKIEVVFGKENQDNDFVPYTEEEIKKKIEQGEALAAITAASSVFF